MGGHISNSKVPDERYGHCLSNDALWVICRSSGLVTILCQNKVVFDVFYKMPILPLSWEKDF